MALLSQMFRAAAVTGDASRVNAWCADRQGKQWAERTVQSAFPSRAPSPAPAPAPPEPDPSEQLARLSDLHRRGVVTDAECDALRARLQA